MILFLLIFVINSFTRLSDFRGGPLGKLWGERGIFERQDFFFVIKFLV